MTADEVRQARRDLLGTRIATAAHVACVAWTWLLVVLGEHRPRPSMARDRTKAF